MKLYNVRPEKRTFDWGEMDVVVLGEKGRARREVLVPFHAEPDLGAAYEIGSTRTGAPKIVSGQPGYGWIALLSSAGVYTRGTYGDVYVGVEVEEDGIEIMPDVDIIAHGWGRYGQAGRVGGWEDYLVIVPGDVVFYVVPVGGWKREDYYLVFTVDEVFKVMKSEVEVFIDGTGIELPVHWVRLSTLEERKAEGM